MTGEVQQVQALGCLFVRLKSFNWFYAGYGLDMVCGLGFALCYRLWFEMVKGLAGQFTGQAWNGFDFDMVLNAGCMYVLFMLQF